MNCICYRFPCFPRLMTEYAHSKTGIDIHPGATIGEYFFIDHGTGIVVGENSVVGGNAFITRSIDANSRVSMKNLEMEYRTSQNEVKTEEVSQGAAWYYMI